MNKIFVFLGALPVLAIRLPEGETRLGRGSGNDLVLSLPEVAESHAVITTRDDGRITLEVTEGESVSINGKSTQNADLQSGDEITLGGYLLVLRGDPATGTVPEKGHSTSPLEAGLVRSTGSIERVIVSMGRDAGREAPLTGETLLIGRSPECDLVLHDETVSWRHVLLERVLGGVRVRDLESRNGTLLDGHQIYAAKAASGARVRIGRTTLLMAGATESSGTTCQTSAGGLAELIGSSKAMQTVYDRIREAATTRVPVLISGETGTGKELTARAIHSLGPRASGPFVPINCAAVPKDLLESQLFGHEKGTFTGADKHQVGLFELADGGTVFLDEVSELPLELQPKLLRVVEDGQVRRLGGATTYSDFRVLAATNRDLESERSAGRFRSDLFYRLAVARIDLPPLSDRLEDLSDLVQSFLGRMETETGIAGADRTSFEESAFLPLREYAWPGNVRELRNLIARAVMRTGGAPVSRDLIEELMIELTSTSSSSQQAVTLQDAELIAIRNTLRDCAGSRREAARRLGIAESTLYEKIKRHGLTDIGR